ncbi:putative leucine-rich repeat-containing, plant-type, leucine-rich repeat domain superfamily [Helianthus annuus]|uniref:Leucine-rich repeat-containing, plant-type, leucine-rich repeat domain superfamily n=1 Tax=Helianthus annuus TaxID=4232 RepID=A0A9K3EDA1_HELAN|nr:putative leucine-rich repeat-containing, plant-type, leucine-rich repeat domain superfamily [Helianthus annuus]KAJ0465942.1 putative leucine-rich repeat-containing, plant-type, leucine-rich repeat domain superfamily [Helianthus annuus]KAJ0487519.1 putative leucine-rich repeat-containing, plant-type, leucine-rich repeat domain superfamily [Helianthus annuus]KAJ0661643.1 putative leucine-rich repeat-containing, plant-type, leucine-rich repeat domain superfamily [Helianthus annuus]KAJ0842266.1 
MKNWNTSTDCCDWNGVTCDHSTGDVIGLDLSCGMVQGRLSNSLAYLNISNCGFSGQVPTDISHLHKLESLDLSSDWYGNVIDHLNLEPHVFINLLQNLTVMKELSLRDVNISALLPTNLNISSSSLKLLNLGSTGLQGKLPHNIFNHHSLETLNLWNNSLTGDIPSEITHLPKLVSLVLSMNGIDSLLIQPHFFSSLLINSTFLRVLGLGEVNIGIVLPTYFNISSSLRSLDLSYTSLQGKLPDNILNLKYLERLELSGNNNLSGPFPKVNTSTSIRLRVLGLSGCGLNGSLPKSLGNLRYLEDLSLSDNMFSGEIPTSIGRLKSLIDLDLWSCGLNGSLPKSLGNLRYLETLFLPNNMLSGEIPTSIVHLKSLVMLELSDCGLNGSLPKSLGNLKYLKYMYLSNNKLSGTLPSSLFTLPSLTTIWLDNNLFQGNVPRELFSFQSLEDLSLGNNQLTGQIDVLDNGPDLQTFQRLTNLTYLDLSYNNFRGDWELDALLSSLTNLGTLILSHSGISVTTSNASHNFNPNFWMLSLASCSLKVFPVSFRAMTNLRYLDLSNNDIQGHVPDWIGEIGKNQLSVLNLSNNSITGTIPNVYEDWSWLEGFILNGNQLEGKVPTSLYRCQKLRIIDLGNNKLSDTLPSWLGELPNLQVLVLRSNNFYGGIATSSKFKFPFPSLRVLDLSHNGFVGQLPTKYFQNFNAMKNVVTKNTKPEYVFLNEHRNYYYSITIVMKGVDQYFPRLSVEYTIVDLSDNKFEGEIPNIIGYLKSLKVLNLSHNTLTGQIPHSLGNISEIESLDLSWNQLTGVIPQSLADLTFLEILNLSQNHLVGRIPQGKQFNTFDGYAFGGNPKLCGLPLPKRCSEHLQKPQPEGDVDEEESGFTWKVVMMGYGCGTFLGFVLGLLMLSIGRPKWFIAIADAAEYVILTIQDKRR